jgi:8-oxo-dGTP diphosphatase
MSSDQQEYPRPSLTADVVVVALEEHAPRLRVLVIRRGRPPFAGAWALPGGFVEPTETVGQAALRELAEETRLEGVHVEELGCFSAPGRDPRGWVVSIAHLALVPADKLTQAKAGDDAAEAAWHHLLLKPGGGFRIEHQGAPVDALAFDHRDIIAAAAARLVDRIGELAFDLLPETFPATAAQRAFEAILGSSLDPVVFPQILVREELVVEVRSPEAASPPRYRRSARRRRWPFLSAGR